MKRIVFSLLASLLIGASVQAQSLTLKKKYVGAWPSTEKVSQKNKPNGNMYRLREELQCDDLMCIPAAEEKGATLLKIAERTTDGGWIALYRSKMSSDDYAFFVIFYDEDKLPEGYVDLCDWSETYNCEVQDIRYDAETGDLMFNMACPSYANIINGKGSKLFCYNTKEEKMRWSTPYLTSNDIFTYNKDYVFCSYGFTNEKDYVFMVDRKNGKVLSKLPTAKKIEYMELQEKGGKEYLYAVDYNNSLYIYNINKTTPKPAAKK